MDTKTRKELASALDRERAQLLRTVAMTDEERSTLGTHETGPWSDGVAATTAATVLARLEAREREELREIEAAQARLAAGTFGVCLGCREAIALKRLRALPSTRYCVRCEVKLERAAPSGVA